MKILVVNISARVTYKLSLNEVFLKCLISLLALIFFIEIKA